MAFVAGSRREVIATDAETVTLRLWNTVPRSRLAAYVDALPTAQVLTPAVYADPMSNTPPTPDPDVPDPDAPDVPDPDADDE